MADTSKKVYIVLEDGHIFSGKRFGADGDAIGELVFTTSVGGYIETITDPACLGQIVLQSFPLIGNYGIIPEDMEAEKPVLSGYVVRDLCNAPSNFRCEGDLDTFLRENGIVGVYGVDTREMTRVIRENGVMNAKITDTVPEALTEIIEYKTVDAVKSVSCREGYTVNAGGDVKYKVAVLDLGVKKSLIGALTKRGATVTVLPYNVAAEELCGYDGVVVSNGPGEPADAAGVIETLSEIKGKTPIMGIGLGHLLFAMANGAEVKKMKHGHHGANQPVKDTATGRVYITSQAHTFEVDMDTLSENACVSYKNVNDGGCEGIEYAGMNAFTVQHSPEGCSGPKDTEFLFDKFINMLGGNR